MLVRLLYASRMSPTLDAAELQRIVSHSQAYNHRHGITGALCLSGGVFMQVLEGGRSAVNVLYAHILRDARHSQVELLSYESIEERRFASWAMGHVAVERLNPSVLLKYSATTELDPYCVPGSMSLKLFDELVRSAAVVG